MTAQGPHTLYVAWGFAPHRGPGVYRPLATVGELVRRGHRVTVLTTDLDTFDLVIGSDRGLLDDVDPSVRVVRVPTPALTRDPLLNRWSRERVTDPQTWGRKALADQVQSFSEVVYAPWQRRVEAVACTLHEEDPVDLVIATGNPYVDWTVPVRLHEEYGVPYVLDDRDAWLLDVYTGEENPDAARIEPWLDHALAGALRMWFVNPPLAEWHRERFPLRADKIRVVENGWDARFLDVAALDVAALHAGERGVGSPDKGLVYSFVGTINDTLPLRLLADGWRAARAQSPVLARSELRFVGHVGHGGVAGVAHSTLVSEYETDGLVFTGRQSKHLIGQAYATSDVLLFAKEGSRFVTSGKVYEYVATGLPIVSALQPGHDARRVLTGYPRWHDAVALTPEGLADALLEAVDDARDESSLRAAAMAHGATFRRDVVLASALDDVEAVLASTRTSRSG